MKNTKKTSAPTNIEVGKDVVRITKGKDALWLTRSEAKALCELLQTTLATDSYSFNATAAIIPHE